MKCGLCLLLVASILLTIPSALATTPNSVDIITETEIADTIDGQMHYLIVCLRGYDVDVRNRASSAGLLIGTVDTNRNEIMFTTILPQTFVKRPDGEIDQLKNIESRFGIDALISIISTHYGLKIDKYILMDFNEIINVINSVGGVDLELFDIEFDEITSKSFYSKDQLPVSLKDGLFQCQGSFAIHYMREKGFARRINRTNEVIHSLAKKAAMFDLNSWVQLVQSICENITDTNMKLSDLMLVVENIANMRGFNIRQLNLPQTENVISIASYDVNYVACREKLHEFLLGE